MTCGDVLRLGCMRGARVVASEAALEREVRWVHVIDNPDAATWARAGQLVLTTGYAWPRDDAGLSTLFADLARADVTAVGLAVPQFFDAFPAAAVAQAEKAGMVLIEVPWEVPFALITEEVHTALLGEQARLIERSEVIHRALTRAAASAASLDVLASALAAETGHEVAIVASTGDVLATTLAVEQRPVLAALGSLGRGSVAGVPVGAARVVAGAAIGPAFAWGTCGDAYVQGDRVATVWLLGGAGAAGPLDERAVEHAALVTALRLTHQRELATLESRLRRSVVDDLLEGRVDATGLVAERAHAVGFSNQARYRVALAELSLEVPLGREAFAAREAALERVRRALTRRGAADLVTTSSNRLYVLLPEVVDEADLWEALEDPQARVSVSRAHRGFDGVQRAFEEARASLAFVPAGASVRFDDLLLPRAVRGDPDAQRELVRGFVAPLEGGRSGAKLIETLFALAEHDFVLVATARSLGIHISTLRHRLERIEHRLGVDLRDADLRFRVRVAGFVRGA